MTTIFCDNPGSCIEPGGYTLDNNSWETDCPDCGKDAREHHWEAVEGGSINQYFTVRCGHCGHVSGNGIEDHEVEDAHCVIEEIAMNFEFKLERILDAVDDRLDAVGASVLAGMKAGQFGNIPA